MSAKDLLLAAVAHKNLTPVPIPELPELDGKIYVRVLNAAERHLYGAIAMGAHKEGEYISDYEIVAICACDGDGTPLFHEREEDGSIICSTEDVKKLRQVDGRAIHAIATMAIEVSGMDIGAKERATKNSESSPADDSSSV